MRSKTVSEIAPISISQAPVILDKKQVAKLLLVSESCVYEMTRERSKTRLPFFKAGKYLRFEQAAINKWIAEQQARRLAA
jgi:excisionase family DNA binding protein